MNYRRGHVDRPGGECAVHRRHCSRCLVRDAIHTAPVVAAAKLAILSSESTKESKCRQHVYFEGFPAATARVEIFRRGDEIVIRERARGMARAFELLASLPDDMVDGIRGHRGRRRNRA